MGQHTMAECGAPCRAEKWKKKKELFTCFCYKVFSLSLVRQSINALRPPPPLQRVHCRIKWSHQGRWLFLRDSRQPQLFSSVAISRLWIRPLVYNIKTTTTTTTVWMRCYIAAGVSEFYILWLSTIYKKKHSQTIKRWSRVIISVCRLIMYIVIIYMPPNIAASFHFFLSLSLFLVSVKFECRIIIRPAAGKWCSNSSGNGPNYDADIQSFACRASHCECCLVVNSKIYYYTQSSSLAASSINNWLLTLSECIQAMIKNSAGYTEGGG